MAKKNDGQITPDNFLDSYRPVSPQRRNDGGDAQKEVELPKVEETQEDNRKNQGAVLPRGQNGVVKTPKDYQDIFLRPNLGESMRYGKTYYVSKEDCKKIKALMRCFGDGWERFPLSVYIHNLLEYHFNEFAELIDEMMRRQQVPNPFQQK
mgnify:CR=1 FL=1